MTTLIYRNRPTNEIMEKPTIYIIGAGAIGKALAVFLQQEHKEVLLVRGSVDNVPDTHETITVIGREKTFQERITTTTFEGLQEIKGIVLITVKAFANADIARKLKGKQGNFPIVLLQNGLHVERPFEGWDHIYRCILFSTSQVTGENEVTFKSVMPSPIGNVKENNNGLQELVDTINTRYFSFRSETDITSMVWTKVIANCAFNSICPLLETDNGIFFRNAQARNLARTVIEECVALAQKQGIVLDKVAIEDNLMQISRQSEGQFISTYVDLLQHRRTEIESLNLEISRMAKDMGVPELVTRTRLLGELIQVKSLINIS